MSAVLKHADGRPFGMPKKAYAIFIDTKAFAAWIKEREDDEDLPGGALGFICAQVASGVTLKQLAEHYVIDYGLLWAWVSEGERLERYYTAQRGVAEYYVGETVGIADEPEGDVGRDKLRIDTRFRIAKSWNRDRYGDGDMQLGAGLENLTAVLQRISERRQRQLVDIPTGDITDVQPLESRNGENKQREETKEITDADEGSDEKAGVLSHGKSTSGIQGSGGRDRSQTGRVEGRGGSNAGGWDTARRLSGEEGEPEAESRQGTVVPRETFDDLDAL